MPTTLTLMDRLRIESRVWALDQQLYDLPRRQRIATRREVRSNLVSAAQSVGTRQALTNLGTTRQLAEEYLTAQYGPAPRASWLSAGVFMLTAVLVLTSILSDAAQAFADGVLAASPDATGASAGPVSPISKATSSTRSATATSSSSVAHSLRSRTSSWPSEPSPWAASGGSSRAGAEPGSQPTTSDALHHRSPRMARTRGSAGGDVLSPAVHRPISLLRRAWRRR